MKLFRIIDETQVIPRGISFSFLRTKSLYDFKDQTPYYILIARLRLGDNQVILSFLIRGRNRKVV